MNKDFIWEPDEENLNENDTLYTDIVAQLISSWFTSDTKIIASICESISEDVKNNESAMPGILFGSMLHITTLLGKVADEKGISIPEAWNDYLTEYNTNIRKRMSQISVMHPKIADEISRKLLNDDD
jgi:hypothetical protein